MKLCEAIEKTDSLIQNGYELPQKIGWLSEVDGQIYRRILSHYTGSSEEMPVYDENTDMDTVLAVPAPHDGLYVLWLETKIAYYNGESERYENAYIMFNNALKAFGDDYCRTHKPKSSGTWKF